jgi:hypothetical protein
MQLDKNHFLAFDRSTILSFWSSLAEEAFLPPGFADAPGGINIESVRVSDFSVSHQLGTSLMLLRHNFLKKKNYAFAA